MSSDLKINKIKKKIIVVTGGVFSSLGKGIFSASIGRIFFELGLKVSIIKFDPYLNIDTRTMSPLQHGEVFVTNDGMETDLDLGHYERFLEHNISCFSSITSGKIYEEVIKKERSGYYEGKTVQLIPHVTNEIIDSIYKIFDHEPDSDILIIEIGGTVGDIESMIFLEAMQQLRWDYNNENICFIHLSPLININSESEIKTKPTQHSIRTIRNFNINPNILVLRSEIEIEFYLKEKIAINTSMPIESIYTCLNSKSIYLIPEMLYKQNIHKHICEYFNIVIDPTKDLSNWLSFTQKINAVKKHKVKLAIIGKYTNTQDSYYSIIESFKFAAYELAIELEIKLFSSKDFENDLNKIECLKEFDAICVPYGFGSKGIKGKIQAIQYARENKIPFFGICLGMQLACIEFAQNVLHKVDANSKEFDSKCQNPIIIKENSQLITNNIGEDLRIGSYECLITKDSWTKKLYQQDIIHERHRHRYKFNDIYLKEFQAAGAIFPCQSNDDQKFQEVFEIIDHPFFVTCQFHPEFKSRPSKPGKYFLGLLSAAIKK